MTFQLYFCSNLTTFQKIFFTLKKSLLFQQRFTAACLREMDFNLKIFLSVYCHRPRGS